MNVSANALVPGAAGIATDLNRESGASIGLDLSLGASVISRSFYSIVSFRPVMLYCEHISESNDCESGLFSCV